jgi:hypothetical protein
LHCKRSKLDADRRIGAAIRCPFAPTAYGADNARDTNGGGEESSSSGTAIDAAFA